MVITLIATHRGFVATGGFSDQDECFVGHVDGTPDVVSFHAVDPETWHEQAADAIDDYIESQLQLASEHLLKTLRKAAVAAERDELLLLLTPSARFADVLKAARELKLRLTVTRL